MVSRNFISGWALIVIANCGNSSSWINVVCLVLGGLLVLFKNDDSGKKSK